MRHSPHGGGARDAPPPEATRTSSRASGPRGDERIGSPPRSTIPRPCLGSTSLLRRLEACAWRATARSIEFTLGVLRGVAFPVQLVSPCALGARPVIFVANHRSLLDTPFIRWSMPRQVRSRLVTVGGFDYFEPRGRGWTRVASSLFLRFVVDAYRVWMIDRRLDGTAHLGQLAERLDEGWSLLLYPEGSRSRSGRMGPMQPGAALLAQRCGVAVVPIFIGGSDEILPPGRFWPASGRLRIRAGAPMRPEPLEHPEAFMRRVRAAIAAISNGEEAVP
ncbi:MAG: 1-acyl-sn-glycerol-3-phosphate acyltransferase [Phycisphaeraceae bacterium]|nr:1-acyl-sn-glycerol-3-phosphate acyltransferase [Phycisphaeraceae bacterium]